MLAEKPVTSFVLIPISGQFVERKPQTELETRFKKAPLVTATANRIACSNARTATTLVGVRIGKAAIRYQRRRQTIAAQAAGNAI
jgi:hypothetical protein